MIDVLAPLALLALAAGVVLFVWTARKQRRQRAQVLADLADERGWRHLESDDGTAQRLSEGFGRFARFHSPTLGEKIPAPVVLGSVDEGRVCLFLHGTRDHEGDARQWTVCLIEARDRLGPDLEIRPLAVPRPRRVGVDPVVTFGDARFEERFEVRSADPAAARDRLDAPTRELLVTAGERLAPPVASSGRETSAGASRAAASPPPTWPGATTRRRARRSSTSCSSSPAAWCGVCYRNDVPPIGRRLRTSWRTRPCDSEIAEPRHGSSPRSS